MEKTKFIKHQKLIPKPVIGTLRKVGRFDFTMGSGGWLVDRDRLFKNASVLKALLEVFFSAKDYKETYI